MFGINNMYIINWLKQYLLRYKIRNKAIINRTSLINNVIFEGHNILMRNVIVSNSFIGEGTYINDESKIYNCKIGRYCSIADNVCVVLGQHPINKFASTYPAFYYDTTSQLSFTFHKGKPLYTCKKKPNGEASYNVVVGNDVWIGSHVLILGGITIGDGAVIAAGAVVTKDVEPYSIVGGVPAKIIKYRFNKDEIEVLLLKKWWNRSFEDIMKNYDQINNIVNFSSSPNKKTD